MYLRKRKTCWLYSIKGQETKAVRNSNVHQTHHSYISLLNSCHKHQEKHSLRSAFCPTERALPNYFARMYSCHVPLQKKPAGRTQLSVKRRRLTETVTYIKLITLTFRSSTLVTNIRISILLDPISA